MVDAPEAFPDSAGKPLAEAAVDYAAAGIPVFPVQPRGKHPVTCATCRLTSGFKHTTTDTDTVTRWWEHHPDANIGTVPGDCGLIGFDLDGHEQMVAFRDELTANNVPEVNTAAVVSGRVDDGAHVYYATTDTTPTVSSALVAIGGHHVTVRGEGGYLILPPSIHPSGRAYTFRGTARYHLIGTLPNCLAEKLADKQDTHALVEPEEVQRLLRDLNAGTTGVAGRERVGKAIATIEDAENRHPAAVKAVVSVLRSAGEGIDIDVPDALNQLRDALAKRTQGENRPRGEFDQIVAWAASQIINDPPTPNAGIGSTPTGTTVDIGVTNTKALRFNDVDNATRFINLHGGNVRYIARWGKWLVWQNHRWVIDHKAVLVHELGKDVSRGLYLEAANANDEDAARSLGKWASASATKGRIDSFIELARGIPGVLIDHDDLDADPWLLGVRNGVVDLRTGKHRPGDPSDLITMQAEVAYEPDATCPKWDACLEEWFPDPEVRDYVQRLIGSSLVGEQREHFLVIHYGNGANGKGTFFRALGHVLGNYYITPHKALLVESRHEGHPTDRAALFRKRLAVAVETDHRQRLNEAQVKNLTGGDQITARRMREDFWTFWPSHSLCLQTNYLPEIEGADEGIWRRLKVVEWVATFTAEDRDEHLDEKLREEAAGILNWALEGCRMWQERGLVEPKAVITASANYRAAEDVLTRFAAETGLTFAAKREVPVSVVTAKLNEWCEQEGIPKPPPPKRVNEWMRTNRCTRVRKRVEGFGQNARAVWQNAGFDTPTVSTVSTVPVKPPKGPHVETNRKTGHTRHTNSENASQATPFPDLTEESDVSEEVEFCASCGNVVDPGQPLCTNCDGIELFPEPTHRPQPLGRYARDH